MVKSVCSSALQSCTDLIGDQFSYFHSYKTNFENILRAQVEKLTLVRQRVWHKIDVAELNMVEIQNDVREWLSSVENLLSEADEIMKDVWKTNNWTHQLSKKAARNVKTIDLLLSQGESFFEIVSRPVPDEISSLITSSQTPFISLRNYKSYYVNLRTEVEKLMDAKQRVQHMMDVAIRNGETIYEDVLKWVTNVEKVVDDTRRTFEDFGQKANTRCLLCPDLITRYHLGNKAVRQLKAVVKLRGEGVFHKVSYTIISPNICRTFTKVYETFGSRMKTFKGLYMALKNPRVKKIGVYGMGGIGKTVLAKQVAAQAGTDKTFNVVLFVEINPTPDIKRIQGDIADQLGLMFHDENVVGRALKLYYRLKRENNILVILDNVWKALDLRRVGIPAGRDDPKRKLLLVSRNRNVLDKMGSEKNFKLGVLNQEEAFRLFKKMAGDSAENQELQSLAIDITKACGGLPIAIASIAMALRGKGVFKWRNALRELAKPSVSNFTGILAEVYSSIKLSYDHLRSEELKSTFLLSSLMKNSGDVSITELFKYGISLDLSEDISLEKAQNKVRLLVHELESSCLLNYGHSSDWYTIHDVVRLVAISIASRDQYALTNEATDWLDKDALGSCKVIFIHDSNIRELPEGLNCPQLNFFIMLAGNLFMKIPDNFFTGMRNLSVLNLTKMYFLSMPSSLHLLVNLRTLCLDQCILGNVTGIGDLKNLESLRLPHSDIKLLPKDIGKLTRLRILDVSNCSKLKVISPNVISSLSCLEELYMGNSFVQWEVEGLNFEGKNASLNELKHLSKLKSLEIHIKDVRILPRDLFSKNNLRRYKVFIGDEWEWLAEYESSRTLKLKLNTSILEYGIIWQLKRIEELWLGDLQGGNNVLYKLGGGGFPQLKHLHVQNDSSFRCISESGGSELLVAFPLLESLFLNNLINLEKIFQGLFTAESFCKLKIIKVEKCDKLKSVFCSM